MALWGVFLERVLRGIKFTSRLVMINGNDQEHARWY